MTPPLQFPADPKSSATLDKSFEGIARLSPSSIIWYTRASWAANTHPISTVPNLLFYVPLLVVILSYPGHEYNSATGHFVWLVWSPGTVSHCTFVPHLHCQLSENMLKTHLFSRSYSTDKLFPEYEQRTLYYVAL